jgi:hypothetical protein
MIKFVIGLVTRIWLWLTSSFRRAPQPLRTVHLEELPEQLEGDAVYVLGEGPHKWFVALPERPPPFSTQTTSAGDGIGETPIEARRRNA